MKYYVVADVHGYYTELYNALDERGFFTDTEPHKLVVCGDLFDRGSEALEVQAFVVDLLNKEQAVLIRGNHEDLVLDLLSEWENYSYMLSQHNANGTVDTVLQLTETRAVFPVNARAVKAKMLETPFIKDIIPKMLDYFETEHYVFVHGWIPCACEGVVSGLSRYVYQKNWREAGGWQWHDARWYNGMEAARQGVIEPRKTIVCGHWHTSYGHSKIEGVGTEFGDDADFSPYAAEGIIALDACTARTHKVNCIVLED